MRIQACMIEPSGVSVATGHRTPRFCRDMVFSDSSPKHRSDHAEENVVESGARRNAGI
jgi:hypothetical protein